MRVMPLAQTYRGRRAATIANDDLRVTVLEEGGHIAEILDTRTFNNAGNALWLSTNTSGGFDQLHNSIFNNQSGATFDVESNLTWSNDSGNSTFMAKWRLLVGSTTSNTCDFCPVCSNAIDQMLAGRDALLGRRHELFPEALDQLENLVFDERDERSVVVEVRRVGRLQRAGDRGDQQQNGREEHPRTHSALLGLTLFACDDATGRR